MFRLFAALLLGSLVSQSSDASTLAFSCLGLDVMIRPDTGSAADPFDQQSGCPGPLAAHAAPGSGVYESTATVALATGRIDQSASYTPVSDGTLSPYHFSHAGVGFVLSAESPDLRIVPTLSGDGMADWNALVQVFDEHGAIAQFFSGTPIQPAEGAYVSYPPVADVTIPLEPGHAYSVISTLTMSVSAGEGLVSSSRSLSLDLFAVPEPTTALPCATALAALAIARRRATGSSS
jgi:hypothetical protein